MVKVSMQQNNETKNEYKFGAQGSTPTPSGDISNEEVTFTEASTRANISTGETLAVICGKIKKFFTDLKAVAFSGSYNDLTDKPTIPTVNNATLTIKQGGTTKGTFTANASTDVEIDLDAGGGGGSEYTAGNGITITNNVISVTNPITKTQLNFDDAVIPCLMINTNGDSGVLLKLDGTNATLADCLDLGASTLNIGAQFLRHWENVSFSGSCKIYDYSTQKQTTESYSGSMLNGTSQVYTLSYDLFTEGAQIIQTGVNVGSTRLTMQIVIGKANGHLYAFVVNQLWDDLSKSNYIDTCTLNADIEFTKI